MVLFRGLPAAGAGLEGPTGRTARRSKPCGLYGKVGFPGVWAAKEEGAWCAKPLRPWGWVRCSVCVQGRTPGPDGPGVPV